MKQKNKFLTTMMICLASMILWCGAVLYAEEKEDKHANAVVLTEGTQSAEIDVTNEDEQHYFAFTAKEGGRYRFDFSQRDKEYGIEVVVTRENGYNLFFMRTRDNRLSVECTFKAGEKYYLVYSSIVKATSNYPIDINVSRIEPSKIIVRAGESEVKESNVNGLSWDVNSSTLTLNNYVSEDNSKIYIDMTECEFSDIVYIDVKGTNVIKNKTAILVEGDFGVIVFTGTGELNIGDEDIEDGNPAIETGNKIIFEGPSINIVGRFKKDIINAENMIMISGSINVDMYPYKSSDSECRYGVIRASLGFNIAGGTILIRYEDPIEGCKIGGYGSPIDGPYWLGMEGGNLIITGNEEVIDSQGILPSDMVIEEGAVILKGKTIDISKLKIEVLEKSFEYDGKEKKAKFKIEGLKEGVDYKAEYKNNVNVGKAEIIVTGIGNFTGTLKANFDIVAPKVNKADNSKVTKVGDPKVGSTVEDENYIYVITKTGSNDGKTVGEVKVTGLKKKSLKEIKIAANVKIGGVSYKVTSIAKNAFKGNKKITKATIGKNVVSIGNNAFANCKKLKQVKINSKKLKKIGNKVFYKCKNLKKLVIKSTKLSKVGKGFVKGTSKKLVITVPKKKKAKYVKKFKKAGFKGKVK